MDDKRLKSILVRLKRYELTSRERQFIKAVERHFHEKGVLTDQQESLLEGIHREKIKIWVRKSLFNQYNHPKDSSPKVAQVFPAEKLSGRVRILKTR